MDVYAYPHLGHAGRLGNQLWQVAATIDLAVYYGGRPSIPANWEYRPFLSVPEDFYVPPFPNESVHDVAHMDGGPYYQELRFIGSVEPMLRTWFSPSPLGDQRFHETHGHRLVDMAQQHFTAIHVRRGDYVQHSDRFPLMTPKYWKEAVYQVWRDHPTTTFLVFSDDIPWCRANVDQFGFGNMPHYFVEGHVRPIPVVFRQGEPADIYDLWLMAKCKAHIIANSTFSWWGAYIADVWDVYYPDRWFGDPKLFDSMWNCIPPEWKQLPC